MLVNTLIDGLIASISRAVYHVGCSYGFGHKQALTPSDIKISSRRNDKGEGDIYIKGEISQFWVKRYNGEGNDSFFANKQKGVVVYVFFDIVYATDTKIGLVSGWEHDAKKAICALYNSNGISIKI